MLGSYVRLAYAMRGGRWLYSFWPLTPIISENVQGRAWHSYVVLPRLVIKPEWAADAMNYEIVKAAV